jgi:4-aminobutyrate aminotransferase-like enzyme
LLILDEVYTGFGRTGKWFACEHEAVAPDLICLGKAMAGGFPISACVGRNDIIDSAWPPSTGEAIHTSTFLGHPVGCAMALASIALHLVPELPRRVRELGRYFLERLRGLESPAIGHARGLGLMLGLELIQNDGSPHPSLAGQIVMRAMRDGVLLLGGGPAGNVLSFTPSFTIAQQEIDFVCERLQAYLRFGSVS